MFALICKYSFEHIHHYEKNENSFFFIPMDNIFLRVKCITANKTLII